MLLLLLLCRCTSTSKPVANNLAALIDGRGVETYWIVQDRIAAGLPVDESDWAAMFATPAFQWQAGTDDIRSRIRQRMLIAFDPDRTLIETAAAEAEGYDEIRWHHLLRIRDHRAELEDGYHRLAASDIILDALILVQDYLPPNTVHLDTWTMPVRLLFFGPDAFAGDDAIYLDLLHAMDRDDELILLLAHEFHHEYYEQLTALPPLTTDDELYWLIHALRQLHMEGIADQIDKQTFPLTNRKGLSPQYIRDFNRHYRATPHTLEQFDAALIALARAAETDNRAELARNAWNLLHFGAHPEGFYMANTIREAQGAAALLEDIGNPFAFIRRFQSINPVFSEEAMAFLESLETEILTGRPQHRIYKTEQPGA